MRSDLKVISSPRDPATVAPPYDDDLERAVLGALIAFPESSDTRQVIDDLTPEDFHVEANRQVFRAALELDGRVDLVALTDVLRRTGGPGPSYLAGLWSPGTTITLPDHIKRLRKLSRQRAALVQMHRASGLIAAGAEIDDIAAAASIEWAPDGDVVGMDTAAGDYLTQLEQRSDHPERTFIPTGWRKLDTVLIGLRRGSSTVIAGKTSMGKSAMAISLIDNLLNRGKRVYLATLEMDAQEVLDNLVASRARVNTYSLKSTVGLSDDAWKLVTMMANGLSKQQLFIDDAAGNSIQTIRQRVGKIKPDVVVIDYLQLIAPEESRASRYEQVSQVSRGLKVLAKDFGIPVVTMSQLSRSDNSRADKRPRLSDLRDSGSIEQDANTVILLHSSDYSDEDKRTELDTTTKSIRRMEVIVAKNRGGMRGLVSMNFVLSYQRFEE